MRSKSGTNSFKSTVLPYQPNSCQNCWNKPKGRADDELAPRSHGIYVSLPVFLVEPDGKITQLGYRAQCIACRNVRNYDGKGCLYRLDGRTPDFGVEYWDIVRRYGLDPKALNDLAFSQCETRYFEVAKLSRQESSLHRAEFYEPKYERCELYV